jgi:hypothetical protein
VSFLVECPRFFSLVDVWPTIFIARIAKNSRDFQRFSQFATDTS